MSADHVTVRIYGENYPLKTDEDPEYVAAVARLVDERMREAAASGKIMPASKVAVLAALHIADELLRLRHQQEPDAGEAERRIERLAEELGRVLDHQAPKA